MNYKLLEINIIECEKNIESSFYHIKGSLLINYYMLEINLTICEKQGE